jgi:hypothetical protein
LKFHKSDSPTSEGAQNIDFPLIALMLAAPLEVGFLSKWRDLSD